MGLVCAMSQFALEFSPNSMSESSNSRRRPPTVKFRFHLPPFTPNSQSWNGNVSLSSAGDRRKTHHLPLRPAQLPHRNRPFSQPESQAACYPSSRSTKLGNQTRGSEYPHRAHTAKRLNSTGNLSLRSHFGIDCYSFVGTMVARAK